MARKKDLKRSLRLMCDHVDDLTMIVDLAHIHVACYDSDEGSADDWLSEVVVTRAALRDSLGLPPI